MTSYDGGSDLFLGDTSFNSEELFLSNVEGFSKTEPILPISFSSSLDSFPLPDTPATGIPFFDSLPPPNPPAVVSHTGLSPALDSLGLTYGSGP